MTHRHTLRVRYGECDMQGVVFNAHYLAYCDDALTAWMAAALPEAVPYFGSPSPTFDYMVKKAELTWTAPFRFGDVVDLDCSVVRWGTTSFDVRVPRHRRRRREVRRRFRAGVRDPRDEHSRPPCPTT